MSVRAICGVFEGCAAIGRVGLMKNGPFLLGWASLFTVPSALHVEVQAANKSLQK